MSSDAPVRLPIEAETRLAQVWGLPPERISELTIEELRDVARALCDGAHRQSLLPEQLIVAVKHSWSAHAGLQSTEDQRVARHLLTDLITLCIQEFYLPAGAPRHSPRGAPRTRSHHAASRGPLECQIRRA